MKIKADLQYSHYDDNYDNTDNDDGQFILILSMNEN